MRTMVTVLAIAGLAASWTAVPNRGEAQVTKQGQKYLLRMKWNRGAVFNYSADIRLTQAPQGVDLSAQQPMRMGLRYEVKSVSGRNGTVEVRLSMPGQQPQTQTVTMNDRGRVVSGEARGGTGNVLEFPERPVGIGESWKTRGDIPGPMGTMTGDATHTLRGFRTVNGRQFAHVESRLTTSAGSQMRGNGRTDTLVDMRDGMMLRSTMNMTLTMTPPRSGGGTGGTAAPSRPQTFAFTMALTRS